MQKLRQCVTKINFLNLSKVKLLNSYLCVIFRAKELFHPFLRTFCWDTWGNYECAIGYAVSKRRLTWTGKSGVSLMGETLILHLQYSTLSTDVINYKCRPIIYLHWCKDLRTHLFLKIHNYSRVNKWKLFEFLFEDVPKSKRQRSKKQSGIPMVSCFTPAMRSWKYWGLLIVIHMQ